ncbi:hypothetical protein RHMOL_Rhmol06G0174300 [Rhododendron molle]|uniref:Uncharacterized protein n=1 Tax=Rhododendron molle TaxID=49168 RepID=A0ACC0NFD0_RHOML|nr:hypothetical protein RHMOL_Rhmol06G0174300 [Rhododendron molle]
MTIRWSRLLDFESEVPPEIDLYSLSTGAWRNISHLGLPYVINGRATQAYLNGAAHWIGADMESLVLLGSPEKTKEDEVACEEEKEVDVGCGQEEIESTEAAETRHYTLPT